MNFKINNVSKRYLLSLSCFWLLCGACLFAFVFCCGCSEVDKLQLNKIEKKPSIRVTFDSFINVNYGKSRSLPGWLTTRDAIAATLENWFSDFQQRQYFVDGTPEDLEKFLSNLPQADESDISIVYLGSIQNIHADWEFVDGQYLNWRYLLEKIQVPINSNRVIIFDTCHAQAICDITGQNEFFNSLILLASSRSEKTYQFNPSALHPIDIKVHYPWAWQWGETNLSEKWDKHISFLGLVWLQSASQRKSPPCDIEQWRQFFGKCAANSSIIENTIGRRFGSTVMTCP